MTTEKNRGYVMADRVCHRASVSDRSLRRGTAANVTFFGFMESVIERLVKRGQAGTAANYRAALRSFRRFRKDRDLTISEVDSGLIEDYQTYLTAGGLVRNTVSFYMRILRAVYNRAVREGLTADRLPFAGAFTGGEKTVKRAITSEEIRRICNLSLGDKPELDFARDIFLFLFFCRGMSFVDAAYLRTTDITANYLNYRRRKTGQRLQIRIIPHIAALLAKYSDRRHAPYLLPIITAPEGEERRQYESALRRVNRGLKRVGELSGITVSLTTYVGRHSWATIAKRKNVPINVISDALGHDSPATTRIYLDSMDTSVIDRANDLVVEDL